MNEPNEHKVSKPAVQPLFYADSSIRRGNPLLATLVAIVGMFIGTIGLFCVVGSLFALGNNIPVVLVVGVALSCLGFWLCRIVYDIEHGK